MSSSSDVSSYQLGPVLGAGTVGTIYAAVDRRTGDKVAVKRLHPSVSENPLIRARFRREMTVLERLQHPNIVRYFGGGKDAEQLFYVMELIDGGTVKDLLELRGSLDWKVVVEIGRQVCSALQCAHNHGVIHRDLKPGNLFLTREGEVKLGDFGIARDLKGSDITESGMTVGTHAYMAPEQIMGDSSLSGKADLYSLGCCLFEMLVGRKPFQGDNYKELFDKHLASPPPRVREFVSDCPPELDEIVNQLLAKDPEDRPFNARQVQAVMLRLAEKDASDASKQATVDRVDAEQVADRGRVLLKEELQVRGGTSPSEVSWGRMLVVLVAVIVLAAVATVLSR